MTTTNKATDRLAVPAVPAGADCLAPLVAGCESPEEARALREVATVLYQLRNEYACPACGAASFAAGYYVAGRGYLTVHHCGSFYAGNDTSENSSGGGEPCCWREVK